MSLLNKEWENFVVSNYTNLSSDEEEEGSDIDINEIEQELFISKSNRENKENELEEAPNPTEIYISTKTKIAYLNIPIDLRIFWKIPIISYYNPMNGVIKKQIKINSMTMEELNEVQEKLKHENHFDQHIITSINNPNGRIKFKDIRKISIGLCKKDIMSYRCKKKSAFYNCFVLILRIKVGNIFKEFHVKVFNTGKMEIPGIQNDQVYEEILEFVKNILQPHVLDQTIDYKPDSCETVLINSNFNCGFYINREIFYDILKMKYNIQAIFDPCSYPGIQCKFYYNPETGIQTGSQISEINKNLYKNIKKVSFMIFRTGSVLIVGKCDECILRIIYKFLVEILCTEYPIIRQNLLLTNVNTNNVKNKKKKIRKKNIIVSNSVL
jgi:hypothetical protein